MNKNVLLALAILSVVCLCGGIFVCVVEPSTSNGILAAVFLISAVYFFLQYRNARKS